MKYFNVSLMVLAVLAVLFSLAAAQSFGPVLFPNTPPGSETSGVVVGASGYGFVPPGGRTGGSRGSSSFNGGGAFGSEDYL